MKSSKKFDIKIILIMLLSSVVLFHQCGDDDKRDIETINVGGTDYELLEQKIDTVLVEKEVKITEYVPTTIIKRDTVTKIVPADVDTLSILKDYFASYISTDTLQLDYQFGEEITDGDGNKPPSTLGYGILVDTISQNKIQSRKIDWVFKVPTIYNTKIVKELPKNEFYWGGAAGFNEQDVVTNVNGSLLWKTKSNRIFRVGLGVQNNSNTSQLAPYVDIGLYWKLGK